MVRRNRSSLELVLKIVICRRYLRHLTLLSVSDGVLKTERNVEKDTGQEGESDVDLGVLGGVQALEVGRFVDGDVPVDGHEDDDVDGAGHEGVDDGHFQMSFVESDGEGLPVETVRYVLEGGDSGDEDAEVGHGQAEEVHVHHTCSGVKGIFSRRDN